MDQNPLSIRVSKASESDLLSVYEWFDSLKSITDWGGPGMEYPMPTKDFINISRIHEVPTFKLTDLEGLILGFGQFYLRVERIHFGRIAISPSQRGRGLGRRLMQNLMVMGEKEFGQREYSLFVMRDNQAAKTLYQSLGFTISIYPEPMTGVLANCDYMTLKNH